MGSIGRIRRKWPSEASGGFIRPVRAYAVGLEVVRSANYALIRWDL